MKRSALSFLLLLVIFDAPAAPMSDSADHAMQASLDELCASAQKTEQQKLALRIVEICTGKGRSEAQCKQEAAQYGSMNINSYAGAIDIPICAQAAEYRKAHGSQE